MTLRRRDGGVTVYGSSRKRTDIVSRLSSDRLPASASTPAEVVRAAVTPETRATALRARRNARHRLVKLTGSEAADHFAAVLEHDGGLLLRALHGAPAELRETALSAAVTGAQTALEFGVASRAAQAMLVRSSVWQALCSSYQHASLRAGGDEALDKRAALAGQQARLDMLAALDLARVPILAPQKSEPAQDGKRMLDAFYAELDAKESEQGTPPGDPPRSPPGD
jgi:hypothetical protein